ncbi:MAG: hypothetical protein JXR73_12500 [Candidatus Omnitrophica bacterium]|nr:hypothetical protein [Candidatus Omnitrophota bacterium]
MDKITSVALIVAGAVLIALPPVVNYFHTVNIANLLEQKNNIYLQEPISEYYSLGCWLAGVGMIVCSIVFSIRQKANSSEQNSDRQP